MKKDRKEKLRREKITESVGRFYMDDGPLDDFIEILTDLKGQIPKEYRASACIEVRRGYYDEQDNYWLGYKRPETDAELDKRVDEMAAQAKKHKESEYTTYLRLQKKYRNKLINFPPDK